MSYLALVMRRLVLMRQPYAIEISQATESWTNHSDLPTTTSSTDDSWTTPSETLTTPSDWTTKGLSHSDTDKSQQKQLKQLHLDYSF